MKLSEGRRANSVFSSEDGFTLIEVLISFFVISLTIVVFIGGNVKLQQNAEVAFERSQAVKDAHRVIEDMRDHANTGTFPDDLLAEYPDDGEVSGYSTLPDEVVTVDYADTGADPLDVTVTVSWTAANRMSLSSSLRTMITERK